jgi:DNA gyrase inhibitor GyrI
VPQARLLDQRYLDTAAVEMFHNILQRSTRRSRSTPAFLTYAKKPIE